MHNVIGGKHIISENLYALSLVRKEGKEHTFLILEGIKEGKNFIREIHFVIKQNTNNQKGEIIDRDISMEKLQFLGKDCHSYTWSISQNQIQALLFLIENEKERCKKEEINYVFLGDSTTGGWLGNSSQYSGMESATKNSVASVHNSVAGSQQLSRANKSSANKLKAQIVGLIGQSSELSIDSLLVQGHNCHSWAVSLVKSINLPAPTSWLTFLVVHPKFELQGNRQHDTGSPSSNTICRVI